jgi:hypothetical protein
MKSNGRATTLASLLVIAASPADRLAPTQPRSQATRKAEPQSARSPSSMLDRPAAMACTPATVDRLGLLMDGKQRVGSKHRQHRQQSIRHRHYVQPSIVVSFNLPALRAATQARKLAE